MSDNRIISFEQAMLGDNVFDMTMTDNTETFTKPFELPGSFVEAQSIIIITERLFEDEHVKTF